ncbi:hypothetical protein Vi05172_g5053 [Venturia inaequalis]|uniref:Heterokaryon incompatibility domain-containing protein n=1 Tax=Venturia inaequalis TaxID=5025 RepID=A0A8H3UNW6_VENIN|nr:hypothetical protein EG327_009331 [Venturia inaequalis]RDI84913.1 hypothetical protein Vi05172_g5053 [Venturia inaequalis]
MAANTAKEATDRPPGFTLRKSMRAFITYMDKTNLPRTSPPQIPSPKLVTSRSASQDDDIPPSQTTFIEDDYLSYSPVETPEPTFIDPAIIRKWLSSCESNHGPRCSDQNKMVDTHYRGPSWLIDTLYNRIVPGNLTCSYFALSYCWGSSVSTSLIRSNLSALQHDNALEEASIVIPATIKDAMRLVVQLGGRYLWVDKLCVPQDDMEVKKKELESMVMIYAGAYATIVAAQGMDADHGLRGVEGGLSRERGPLTSFVSAANYDASSLYGSMDGDRTPDESTIEEQSRLLWGSTWSSRGWTFQEQLFSSRKIIFQNETVNWDCRCAAWHETQADLGDAAPGLESLNSENAGFATTTWPDFHRFTRLVCLYNIRELTFEQDVLDAFAGALNTFERSFKGGFISGLPEMFFDAALLWQPRRLLTRRTPADPTQAILPSWSWVGWHGTLEQESWRSGYGYIRRKYDETEPWDTSLQERCSWRTFSTVKWSHSISRDSLKVLIPDAAKGIQYSRSSAQESSLPEGWIEKRCGATHHAYFVHESDPTQEFWYPVAIKDRNCRNNPGSSVGSNFLHCRTRRGYLYSKWINPSEQDDRPCPTVKLVDKGKVWAGALRLNLDLFDDIPDEYYRLRDIKKKNANALVRLEFIEISRGEVEDQTTERDSFDEWFWPECPRYSGLYRFYNVMCIEWKEGIAYRKAVGRVVDHVWERIATEEIDVTIG